MTDIHVINWDLNQEAFQAQVNDLIHRAQQHRKVLPLPIRAVSGLAMIDQMTLLIAQVNCAECNAPCCKANPDEKPIQLLPPEYRSLAEKYGEQHFVRKEEGAELPMPCPFLTLAGGEDKQPASPLCTIYPDRPLVCVIYPFQPGATEVAGGTVLALASSCPEGRRVAMGVYMIAWQLRQRFRALGLENFLKVII